MKKLLTAALALATFGTAASAAEQTFIFTCTDRNTSLQFHIHDGVNGVTGGVMYINRVQVANLNAYRVNDISVRASVRGNTGGSEFILNTDRQAVYLVWNDSVSEVCSAWVEVSQE